MRLLMKMLKYKKKITEVKNTKLMSEKFPKVKEGCKK